MKRSQIVRAIAAFIIILMLAINLSSLNYSAKIGKKISDELSDKMSTNTDKFPVSIWITAPDISVPKAAVINSISQMSSNDKSHSEFFTLTNSEKTLTAKTVIENYRSSVRNVYAHQNNDFISKNLEINTDDIIYVSKYAPMIIVNLDNKDIIKLSKISSVISIDYYELYIPDDIITYNYDEYDQLSNLVLNTQEFTGEGVKIGVFDGGIPSDSETQGMNVIAMNGTYNGTHPGFVASILKEIAPDADYYFTGHAGISVESHVEWLLDNGVNVISMSLSAGGDGYSNYGNTAKWFDHIAYNHYVLLVKSSGNISAMVSSPGMAYNVMTVGAFVQNGANYSLASFSGYYTGNTLASKPDICAIGPNGTSEAAPRVAATAALLIEADPMMIYSPEMLKAVLTASVNTNTIHHYVPTQRLTSGTNYMQAGAGLLSASESIKTTVNNQTRCSTITSPYNDYSYTFTVTSAEVGSTVRVSLAYSVPVIIGTDHSSLNVTTYPMPDLNLMVYSPNSAFPSWISATTNNNVEIVEFIPQVSGTYTIKITSSNTTNYNNDIYFGVAWSIQ